jgi:hydrogenase maturation protein HypF
MAENGLESPVIGVTFDGTGFGSDGTIWGGEFLVGDYRRFRRAAHLEESLMPGGEQAIREPWRMAVSYLAGAGLECAPLETRIGGRNVQQLRRMLERRVNCPRTSSVGRLFDGISSLLGVRDRISYEGQAAIELESLAHGSDDPAHYPVVLTRNAETWIVRLGSLLEHLVGDLRKGVSKAAIARRFHRSIVEIIRVTCSRLREESGLEDVVLSGGVFMNELLLGDSVDALCRDHFTVHRHRRVPCNDGGICLGQLAVAAAGGGERSCA